MFVLDVIVNFTRLSDDDLYHQLRRILRQSEDEEKNYMTLNEIGILTSLPRDQWAQARLELIKGKTHILIFILLSFMLYYALRVIESGFA